MNHIVIIPWLCITLILVGISWFRQRGKTSPISEQKILINMGLGVGSVMIFCQVIYKALTIAELYKTLEWDGTIMLCLGCLSGIFATTKEIWKLLK